MIDFPFGIILYSENQLRNLIVVFFLNPFKQVTILNIIQK